MFTPTMSYLGSDSSARAVRARRRWNTARAVSSNATVPRGERPAFGNEQLQPSLAGVIESFAPFAFEAVLPDEPARATEPPAPLGMGGAPAPLVCPEPPPVAEAAPAMANAPALPPLFGLLPPAAFAPPPLAPELLAPAALEPPLFAPPTPLVPPLPATASSSRSTVPWRTTPDSPGIIDVLDHLFKSVLVACRKPQFP